jgi:uncharacterized cupredoxin-like copper-binding protein
MMRGAGWILGILVAALVSACTAPDDWFGNPNDGYPDNSVQAVDAADWATATPVRVELSEFRYSPETLTFRTGQPYELELTNTGSVPHRFLARGFFRAVATRSVIYSDAEAGYPTLEAISLEPGETKTVHFVPLVPGDYHLSCDQLLHTTLGMVGRILIE